MAKDCVPDLLARAAQMLEGGFAELPSFSLERPSDSDEEAMGALLDETARRLSNNYPYFHPMYAGQMLKPPHPIARAAYALAMRINPNNHARDGGRASSEMEIEAVAEIAGMFGWKEYLGHLTSGGTMANLEALWVAGESQGMREQGDKGTRGREKQIVGSEQAHYTHHRISSVLKLDYRSVPADARGRMRLDALEDELRKGNVSTVVVTLGTTAIGAVDPLPEILQLRDRYCFRVHVDAAYGGYFKLIEDQLDEPARRAYEAIGEADSIVIDPHKHGLQPYGCGCVLFRDPGVGRFYKHDSPYTYFTSKELQLHPSEQRPLAGGPVHLGEISLECSRAGAAAVALWATQRLLPLRKDGEFADGLAKGRRAALELDRRLRADDRFEALAAGRPEVDIVVWKVKAGTTERACTLAQSIFSACAGRNLHLALVQLPQFWFGSASGSEELVTCLRSVLMKPEHEAWLDRIWEELDGACSEVENG